jgi:hypothetical protein
MVPVFPADRHALERSNVLHLELRYFAQSTLAVRHNPEHHWTPKAYKEFLRDKADRAAIRRLWLLDILAFLLVRRPLQQTQAGRSPTGDLRRRGALN